MSNKDDERRDVYRKGVIKQSSGKGLWERRRAFRERFPRLLGDVEQMDLAAQELVRLGYMRDQTYGCLMLLTYKMHGRMMNAENVAHSFCMEVEDVYERLFSLTYELSLATKETEPTVWLGLGLPPDDLSSYTLQQVQEGRWRVQQLKEQYGIADGE